MTLEYLEKEQELIETYIERFYSDKITKKASPIYDGVADCEKYLKSKYRICWVLKEPYDEGNGKGGGWSLTQDILAQEELYPDVIGKSHTWQPMVYVTYSLLNGFIPYNGGMDYIRDEPKMAQCLNEIALINVNKMPAETRSNDNDIAEKYEYSKPLLFWQLKQYDPQIIIFGNTFQHFQNDLGIKNSEKKHKGYVDYIVKNKQIYIHAYHPAQTAIIREDYVQNIISVVKENICEVENDK
ncbi:MAG: hypothetical protein Ta2B_15050 [Termitinemataceae bacterium]|nr:MAG: hypothetical protein Ta2B_15050 [Termitinemataceae bacterium]